MTTTIKFVCAVFALAVLAGCASTFKATYDHDPAKDFFGYKTFSWISKNPMKVGQSVVVPNPLLEPRITSALEKAGPRILPMAASWSAEPPSVIW